MLKSQKLTIELSEKRERLNVLLDKAELSSEEKEEREKITKRLIEIEPEIRAAITAEGVEVTTNNTGEDAEMRQLVGRADLGNIFQAVIEHRATSGAEKEIQDHFKLNGNQVPLAMLRGQPEQRAVTPAPGDVGQTQSEIIPGVFPQACASFLGVDMPTVGVGDTVFPVLSTNAATDTPDEGTTPSGTGIDSEGFTTGSFTAEVLTPKRIQAAFFYSREDAARFSGMGEALRSNLSDALSDALDAEIIAGTNGLFTGTNLANNTVSAVTSFASYVSNLGYGRVDGKWASQTADLRVLMGSGSFAHAGTVYRHQNADDIAIERLMEITGGIKVSAHVPAVASSKQNCVIRLGMRRDMVTPIWEGVTLIPDEVTKAKSGEIVLTAVMLHNVKILRTGGFFKQQIQVA